MIFEKETPRRDPEREPHPGKPQARVPFNRWNSNLEILTESTGFHQGPRQRRSGYKLVIWSWAAASVDALFTAGLGMVFLAALLFVVKSQGIPGVGADRQALLEMLFGVYASLSFFYMIMLRSFLGFTLGEWACGLRLGSPLQRQSAFYTLRVLARGLLLFATGIILLPVLSLLCGKDLAGRLTGLSLISLR